MAGDVREESVACPQDIRRKLESLTIVENVADELQEDLIDGETDKIFMTGIEVLHHFDGINAELIGCRLLRQNFTKS